MQTKCRLKILQFGPLTQSPTAATQEDLPALARSGKRGRRVRLHQLAVAVVGTEGTSLPARSHAGQHDWAGSSRALALLWGIPAALMIAAEFLGSLLHAEIWTLMLLWMGGVCLVNARRCGRTHCHFTGPFFILMAVGVVAYASGFLDLGAHGWNILGGLILGGAIGIWWGSERLWGRFMH